MSCGVEPWRRHCFGLIGLLMFWVPFVSFAEDRALLVGLDHYGDPRVPPTPGGAADAVSMAVTLETVFGFSAGGIKVLIDNEATSQAIVEGFEQWLIDGTEPGDRVFFLYAGHGSQLADLNLDETDGYDETLAPFDVDPETGDGQIRDDVIDGLIAQLSGRRAVLLFDSCHSGTLTRGSPGIRRPGAGIRYLPRPDQRPPVTRGEGGSYGLAAAEDGEQSPFDQPTGPGRAAGIVAISAAGPGQLAYPVDVDGEPRGALTYLFQTMVSAVDFGAVGLGSQARGPLQEIAKEVVQAGSQVATGALGGAFGGQVESVSGKSPAGDLKAGMTVSVLETLISSGMKELQESGRLEGRQEPFFEVLSERPLEEEPLFGDWQDAGAAALANPLDDRRVTLRTEGHRERFTAGEAMVLHVGTDRPGFLYLLVFSEQERATCIFPNELDRNHHLPPGEIRIPTHGGYRLPIKEPFGRDVIVALVSDQPLPLCEKLEYRWSDIFARIRLDEVHESFRQGIRRGVTVEVMAASPPAWQTATLEVQTSAGAQP